jgi:transposase
MTMVKSNLKTGKITKFELRRRRVFSEAFKREKVAEITSGKVTVLQLSRLWDVRPWAIYLWIYKYSPDHQKGITMVVQKDSEATKVKDLLARIAELERIVGQKQLAIDFQEKLIEIASKELSVDIKKNFSPKP